MTTREFVQERLNTWNSREQLAYRMVPIIGQLWLQQSVEIYLMGRTLLSLSPVEIVKRHRFTRYVLEKGIHVEESMMVCEILSGLKFRPAIVDVGKLIMHFRDASRNRDVTLEDFIQSELGERFLATDSDDTRCQDVVLYGFGRIGRILARILSSIAGRGDGLLLRAIVVRSKGGGDLQKRASLLRRDSIHGLFHGSLLVDEEKNLVEINGNPVQIIYANDPSQIDYTAYGIEDAILVDNTGVWKDPAGLSQHLKSEGIKSVLLTAPGQGEIPNIVYGVNDAILGPNARIVSAASCTTNAIVPALKSINDKFGIDFCHIETCHSYTNDQNLLDNYHKKPRRGRAAPLNMVLSTTGAASAVTKAIPELTGKVTGNAIRVPTPNVSMAVLCLTLQTPTTKKEINDYLREVSLTGKLSNQIDFTASHDIVSTDLIGNTHAGIVDSLATIGKDNHATVYVWYDNEMGYSYQVLRLAYKMSNLQLLAYR